MGWNSYNLDRAAQELVLDYREVLNQSHKMRLAVPYGLERFWGEHLRLLSKTDTQKNGEYWKATWDKLVEIMEPTGISVPNDDVNFQEDDQIRAMAEKLWGDRGNFSNEDRQITLDVLTQLCDSLVWWTQRYKKRNEPGEEDGQLDD